MGNLLVINREPRTKKEMRELFLEEIRRQKKPYGIHICETLGGETETASYDFQAFKGEILHAIRVYPDGREEPIRGVDFVGTPLSALDSVIAMGDDPELDNGYCGAESGVIPVSTVAPSMLMKNMELQGRDRERYTQFSIPLPYEKSAKKRREKISIYLKKPLRDTGRKGHLPQTPHSRANGTATDNGGQDGRLQRKEKTL